ncbi:sensor histidine kinase [Niabella sp. CJ426]|uniref:sensor histidine kinase n=1 Tax=Niabella sp. CJ426 TaxID=3393740 RepID=UPI003D014B79
MITLSVKDIALPSHIASEGTPFKIMNIVNDQLYLAKSFTASFLILDIKKNHQSVPLKGSINYLKYVSNEDQSSLRLLFTKPWGKALNNKIFTNSEIYEVQDKKLKVFYTPGPDNVEPKIVSSYLEEGDNLYVGFLQSGGLIKYANYNKSSSTNIPQKILRDVEVGDILKDRKGNIWVSTMHDGVFVFLEEGKKMQKLSKLYNSYSDDVWYIKHKNNILELGYKRLVVDQIKNGRLYKRWTGDTTVHFNPVTFFRNYQNKAIIFGKSQNYTTYDNSKHPEIKFSYKDFYISNNEIYATIAGGLRKFSRKLDPITFTSSQEKFNTIFILPDSVYAKGSAAGLYLNNSPTKIKDRVTKVRGYNKDILACTDKGLYIKRGEKYLFIDETKGLPGNKCIQIEYFGDKYYKLLTQNGLAYIDTATCKIAGIFNSQSLGDDVIIHHFDVENDSVWLATNKGIYVLDEHLIFNKAQEPITAYLYPDKLNNRNTRYTQQIYETKYVNSKQIKMLLELLDFSSNNYSISYQVEKDDILITERSQVINNAFIVNTPDPGNYAITVYISGKNNSISKILAYTIKINPLWYQTLWARLSFATSLIIVLWLTIRSITRYVIRGKEKRLKEKYATLQLQSQAFFTQLNPHFIFNALTPLQSHILKNEKIESLEYLDRFSSLMRDILKNSDKMETSLKKEINFINEYIAIQQIRFSPSFIFELTVSETIDVENTSIPAMMLQPIIENAIEHGVKNMGAAGKISVEIGQERMRNKACIRIQISDNGSGITGNILKEGHALYILQKRVQTLQKKDNITASLTHGPGPDGTGTTFKLILPETSSLWSTGQ